MKLKRLLPILLAAVMGISVLAGCGGTIDETKTGATLNGEEISLGFMNFMARYQQSIYDVQFSSMFGTGMWSQDLFNEGTDMETSVKNNVTENIELLYLLEDHMGDYKVEITEDELAKIDEAAEKFIADNTKAAINQMGATKEYVKEMLRFQTIQNKMRKAMDAEVDTEVSDEEAAQKTINYVKVDSNSTTDENGETKEYTEEEKENLKKEVEDFAAAAKKDFEKAAEDAGYSVSKDYSYGKDEETLEEDVIQAADKLKDGEISDLITTEDSYYVVQMESTFDKEATESKKESIVQERKNDHYTEVCDGYKKDAKFEVNEKEWAKVKFNDLFKLKQTETDQTQGEDENNSNSDKEENNSDSKEEENNSDSKEEEENNSDSKEDENNSDSK